MKAVIINEFGSASQLIETEIPKPTPESGELLVEVYACGLNPVDYKIRKGELEEVFPTKFPKVLGGDISGVVSATGEGVSQFEPGDEVYFSAPLDGNGGYAEYAVVSADIVAKKPNNFSHTDSAALPVAGLTAIQTLRDYSGIKAGDNVLIHAGAGGVGSFAIQFAKSVGAKVFTTGSEKRRAYLESLGADVVIDYHSADFVEIAKEHGGIDIILEAVGGDNYLRSVEAAKNGAKIPCIVHPPTDEVLAAAGKRNIKTDFFLLNGNQHDLKIIAQFAEKGTVNPGVNKIYGMHELKEAHAQLESGRTQGKLVLNVKS